MTSITDPDAFLDDPYGWLTNQMSHIGVGIFLVFLLCVSFWGVHGEMPVKAAAYAVIAFGYISFEVFFQGWRRFDTVEDTVFVVGYGAAAILAAFTEVDPGDPTVAVNPLALLPFFIVAIVHLAVGYTFRAMRRG